MLVPNKFMIYGPGRLSIQGTSSGWAFHWMCFLRFWRSGCYRSTGHCKIKRRPYCCDSATLSLSLVPRSGSVNGSVAGSTAILLCTASHQTVRFRPLRRFETVRITARTSKMYTPEIPNTSPNNHKKTNTSTMGQSIQPPLAGGIFQPAPLIWIKRLIPGFASATSSQR